MRRRAFRAFATLDRHGEPLTVDQVRKFLADMLVERREA